MVDSNPVQVCAASPSGWESCPVQNWWTDRCMKMCLASDNLACQFSPTWHFSSNSHVTVFPQACAFTFIVSASCRCFNTCWGPAVPFSVCLSLQQRWCFCWYNLQQFRGLYLVKELTTMEKVSKNFAQEQMEDCSGFVFLKTYDIFFECFVTSVSSRPLWLFWFIWKTGYSLTSQIFSISAAAQIAYRVWVLEAIGTTEQKGSGRETKLKVRKHKQKQIQPSSSKHELMVQVCCTRVTKIDSWCMHDLDRKNCLWNNGFIIMALWYLSCCQNDKCYLCVCVQWQY